MSRSSLAFAVDTGATGGDASTAATGRDLISTGVSGSGSGGVFSATGTARFDGGSGRGDGTGAGALSAGFG